MLDYFRNSRFLSIFVATAIFWMSVQTSAHAAIVGTEEIVAEQQIVIERSSLLLALDREDVKQALITHGVDPYMAKQRVASLTDEEVVALNQQIEEMPAGSGALGLIVFVFIVLLITDILGFTDVFPFVKKTVR